MIAPLRPQSRAHSVPVVVRSQGQALCRVTSACPWGPALFSTRSSEPSQPMRGNSMPLGGLPSVHLGLLCSSGVPGPGAVCRAKPAATLHLSPAWECAAAELEY